MVNGFPAAMNKAGDRETCGLAGNAVMPDFAQYGLLADVQQLCPQRWVDVPEPSEQVNVLSTPSFGKGGSQGKVTGTGMPLLSRTGS